MPRIVKRITGGERAFGRENEKTPTVNEKLTRLSESPCLDCGAPFGVRDSELERGSNRPRLTADPT